MLFDPRVHEPLTDVAWAPGAVEEAVRTIARDADDALRAEDWWPWHPLDSDGETPDAVHGVYLGAAGVLLALQRLAEAGLHKPAHDYARLAAEALESYRRRPEFGGPAPSMWMGESGIALGAWLLSPSDALADRLAELVVVDRDHDTLELMRGSPGLLLVADAMLERTGQERWTTAWGAIAEHLLDRWGDGPPRTWTQQLYGRALSYLGPAHGFAGIVAALARRPELLPAERLAPDATATLAATAVREGDHANWAPALGHPLEDPRGIRVQWCHGAPGMVALAGGPPPRGRARRAAPRRRRADLRGRTAAQGREPLPRHGGQRLRPPEALHANGRRALAGPARRSPCTRRARSRPPASTTGAAATASGPATSARRCTSRPASRHVRATHRRPVVS